MTSAKSLLCMLVAVLCAQGASQLLHPASPQPAFAVTSVRATHPDEEKSRSGSHPDAYFAHNKTVKDVIAYAFGLGYDHEMVNAPAWLSNSYFDMEGKLDEEQVAALHTLSRDDREQQMRLMVQSMLAERFQLKYHFEERELPVYRLEIAKGGFKCPRDTTSSPAIADMTKPRFRWSSAPAPPPPPPGWQPPPPSQKKIMMQALHMRTKGWPFWLIATSLSHQPELEGRPVIDQTGLTGPYDCEMKWSQANSDGEGQGLFSALQDQLGLKLEPSRGPVEVIVIDDIQQPSEN